MKIELSAGFAIDVEAAPGEAPTRQISGVAVPYGVSARVSSGEMVRFQQGSLPTDGKAPKVFMYHDSSMPVGLVNSRREASDGSGMLFTASIVDTQAGTDALTMASAGVLDSVSVGVNIIDSTIAKDGTIVVTAAEWVELSLVPVPAFAGAIITDVAASNPDGDADNDQTTEAPDAPEKSEPVEETPMSELIEAAAPEAVPTNQIFASAKREFAMPTPGEYLAAFHIGGATFANVNEAYKIAADKNKTAFQFANTDTGDFPGTLPNPVLSPVVQNLNYIRPFISAIGSRALPNGNGQSFIRPTISQHTSAAVQAAELDDVSSTTMVVAANQVPRITIGASALMSMQLIDWTDPAAMTVITNDLVGQMMLKQDNYALTGMDDAATHSATWDGTSPADLLLALYKAAYDASVGTNFFVDTLVLSVAQWKYLGQLVDGSDRPVFPAIGAPGLIGMNTLGAGSAASWSGQNPLGLQTVVDSQLDTIDATKLYLLNSQRSFEWYETGPTMMSVEVPNKLARNFSVHSYCATFAAIPSMIRSITNSD